MSRQQELMGSKPEKELQLDVSKTSLVVKEQASNAEIHTLAFTRPFNVGPWRWTLRALRLMK